MVDGTLARGFGSYGDRSVNGDIAVCTVVDVDRGRTEYTHLTGISWVRDDLSKCGGGESSTWYASQILCVTTNSERRDEKHFIINVTNGKRERTRSERDRLRNGTAEWWYAGTAAADRGTRLPRVHTRRGRHLRARQPCGGGAEKQTRRWCIGSHGVPYIIRPAKISGHRTIVISSRTLLS